MIIFIANQFIGNNISTGGDVLSVEMAKRVKGKKAFLSPKKIHKIIREQISDVALISTNNNHRILSTASTIFGGISTVIEYVLRSYNSSIWLIKNAKASDTIYLTGDFLCNSFPAYIVKKKYPQIKVLSNFFHRNPKPGNRPGNNYVVSYFSRFLQTISLRLISSISNNVFVLSEIGKNELIDEGFQKSKIVVSGAGVDKKIVVRRRRKAKNQIVFVGRVNITKGAFDIVQIFSIVSKVIPELHMVMMGGASKQDKKKLLALIRDYSMDNKISYLGFVDERSKYEIISESKVLVLPSKEEGFGIVIMEALALGVPVICYKLPSLKAIFTKYDSVKFVNCFDEHSFAKSIEKSCLENVPVKKQRIFTWEDVYKVQSKYIF